MFNAHVRVCVWFCVCTKYSYKDARHTRKNSPSHAGKKKKIHLNSIENFEILRRATRGIQSGKKKKTQSKINNEEKYEKNQGTAPANRRRPTPASRRRSGMVGRCLSGYAAPIQWEKKNNQINDHCRVESPPARCGLFSFTRRERTRLAAEWQPFSKAVPFHSLNKIFSHKLNFAIPPVRKNKQFKGKRDERIRAVALNYHTALNTSFEKTHKIQ